ncbi:MAG: hypothetical protein NTZ95_07985 [Candidatus Omnitrophica bacterium]|nr:hypothetical protein [Candidatus Omnitrophota bacterium]
MNKKTIVGALLIFVISLSYFALLQFSTPKVLYEPDSYYHIKLAEMIRDHGPIQNFPWAQYSVLGKDTFADFDFLFHLLLIPFTFAGLIFGIKLAGVIFPAILVTILYLIIAKRELPFPFFWAVSIFASGFFFTHRMMYVRPYLISIPLSLLIVDAIIDKKEIKLFILTFLFSWTYVMSVLSVVYALVFVFVYAIKKEQFPLKVLFSAIGGWLIGFVAHPNFPNTLKAMFTRLFFTTASSWGNINMSAGVEMMPMTTRIFFVDLGYVLVLFVGLIYVLMMYKKEISATSNCLILISTVFFVGTLMSRRVVEYSVPFSLYTCAFLCRDLIKNAKAPQGPFRYKSLLAGRTPIAVMIVLVLFSVFSVKTFARDYNYIAKERGDLVEKGALWLKDNSEEKDIVFNCGWDNFAQLLFSNTKNYYIVGLDPTYIYMYNRGLWVKWDMIRKGARKDIYDVVKNDFNAKWIFTMNTNNRRQFIKIADQDPNLERVYFDGNSIIYKLR